MKRIILVALAAVAVVGCKKTDMEASGTAYGEVQFSASTSSLTRTSSDGLSSSWEKGDQIGIYMDGDKYAYNIAYEADADGASASFSVVTADEAICYPTSGTVDFHAYYPYSADLTEGVELTEFTDGVSRDVYVADLADQSDLGAIDFMVAQSTGNEDGDVIAFEFEHQLTKVEFTIYPTETVSNLSGAEVVLSGVYSKASYTYKGDFIEALGSDPIEFNSAVDAETGDLVATAIVNPGAEYYPYLTVTLSDGAQYSTYIVNVSDVADSDIDGDGDVASDGSYELKAGYVHKFELYLGADYVDFTVSTIEKWKDGESVESQDQAERIGSGTAEDPFYVYDAEDLAQIGISESDYIKDGIGNKGGVWSLSAHYKMMNNIDLGGEEWTPIGTSSSAFTGTFDGDSKVITGLYIFNGYTGDNSDTYSYKGVFANIGSTGVVSKLGVIDCDITGRRELGAVAGFNQGTIENCYASGKITSLNGTVVSGRGGTGGITGRNYGTVKKCYNLATIEGITHVGGIAGYQDLGYIISCCNLSSVTGTTLTGGIAGQCDNNTYTVGCINTGDISGESKIGGILGSYNDNTHAYGCFNAGDVYASAVNVYGAIGGDRVSITATTIHNCYYISDYAENVTGRAHIDGDASYSISDLTGYCQAISYDEMIANGEIVVQKLNNALISYNETASEGFEACAWKYSPSESMFPILDFDSAPTETDFGDGTEKNPTQLYFVTDFSPKAAIITTSGTVTSFTTNSNIDGALHYKMMTDIDLAGDANNQWSMINALSGSFDGNGYTLSGVYSSGTSEFALFAMNIGTIKNLNIEGSITASVTAAGFALMNNGVINGCGNLADLNGDDCSVGVASTNNGTIINSYNLSEAFYGFASVNDGIIANCYSIGTNTLFNSDLSAGIIYNSYNFYGDEFTKYYNSYGVSDSEIADYETADFAVMLNSAAVAYNLGLTIETAPRAWEWYLIEGYQYPTLIYNQIAVADND